MCLAIDTCTTSSHAHRAHTYQVALCCKRAPVLLLHLVLQVAHVTPRGLKVDSELRKLAAPRFFRDKTVSIWKRDFGVSSICAVKTRLPMLVLALGVEQIVPPHKPALGLFGPYVGTDQFEWLVVKVLQCRQKAHNTHTHTHTHRHGVSSGIHARGVCVVQMSTIK